MAKRVRGNPGVANTEPFAVAFKELDEGVVAERRTPSFPMTTDEKDKWTFRIFRSFLHHIGIERLKGFWLQEINHSLRS